MKKISDYLSQLEMEVPTEVSKGPQTLHLLVFHKQAGEMRKLEYPAKEGENVQALMIRAANDITEGEIVDMRLSCKTVVSYADKSEEEKALIEQTIAVI